MSVIGNVFRSLFQPAKGVDGAAKALRWLWIPLAVALIASVALKTLVATPMQIKASEKMMAEEMAKVAGDSGGNAEGAEVVMPAEADTAAGNRIVAISAMVFAVLGGLGSILAIAVFFFIAAKTWANPVKFTTMLSVASLGLMPRMLGNLVQAVYMQVTGTWIQHAGLGALVAPEKMSDPPGIAYAFLSQVDVWAAWGILILAGALLAQAVGFDRKRAMTSVVAFVVVAVLLRAVPTIAVGALMGGA